MLISHNFLSRNICNQWRKNDLMKGKAMKNLSSGLRINGAADDAAGLSISQKMHAQIRGLAQAQRNAQDGISLIQTAEGALGTIHDNLQRMRELTIQAANDTLTPEDRNSLQQEMTQLCKEIDRTAYVTQFNERSLLCVPGTINTTIKQGKEWIAQHPGTSQNIAGIASDGSNLLAVGNNGQVVKSTDGGVTWIAGTSLGISTFSVTYGKGLFVATTDWGGIKTSTDGTTWTHRYTTPGNSNCDEVVWTGSEFIAASYWGMINVSTDGITWTTKNTGALPYAFSTTSGNGKILVGGNAGKIACSTDHGNTWTVASTSITGNINDIVWNGTMYVAVGSNGGIVASHDGVTWMNENSGTTASLQKIKWDGSQFIAVGSGGEILTSVDGNAWTKQTSGTTQQLQDIISTGNQLITVGVNGTILTSSDVILTTPQPNRTLSFQVGANAGMTLQIDLCDVTTSALNIYDVTVATRNDSSMALSKIDKAIEKISSERSKFGAYQNRLEHTINNLSNYEENLTATQSLITDADMAKEIMRYTKNNILIQVNQAIAAQANQQSQTILQLLR